MRNRNDQSTVTTSQITLSEMQHDAPMSRAARATSRNDDGDVDVWDNTATILSRYDVDEDGALSYKEFRELCVGLFGAGEIEENEGRVREIFELLDANADGTLDERELQRCYEWIRTTINPINVLLIIDVQNDFIAGTLALHKCGYEQHAEEVIEPINQLLRKGRWDEVIYSKDWHPNDHISFYDNLSMRELHPESAITRESAKPFDTVVFLQPHVSQILWPKHAVMNTWGAKLHKDLLILPSSKQVHKGQNPNEESYSAFCSELKEILSDSRATHLYVCGIAFDICVKETCLDGLRLGYRLAVVNDCCRGTNPAETEATKKLISENGGLIADSDRVISLVNEGKRSLMMAHHAMRNAIQRESLAESSSLSDIARSM